MTTSKFKKPEEQLLGAALMDCEGLAVIGTERGYFHFNPIAGAWDGPRGAPVGFATYLCEPAYWMRQYGHLPPLPPTQK